MKFDERNQNVLKIPPFFISMATAAKFVLPIPIFLAYLVPLDVDVTGNITAKLCEVWREFNIFCILVTMAMATILNFFNPPKAATHYSGYSYKVSWSLMKGIQKCFISPFFVSMATAAKFVQPIPIFWAYLVPLYVDVVPIKFPWQRQPFWKNQHLKAHFHMAYDISTRFHKIWSRNLRETCRTKLMQKKEE